MRKCVLAWLVFGLLGGCAARAPLDTAKDSAPQRAAAPEAPPRIERIQQALLPPLRLLPFGARGEERFDVSANDAPVQAVLATILDDAGYTLTVHPEVAGSVSLNLHDVTAPEALDALHRLYGYEFEVEGDHVYALPDSARAIRTRSYDVLPLLPAAADGATAGGGRFWEDLGMTLRTLVGCSPGADASTNAKGGCPEGRTVALNPRAGTVVVRAAASELKTVDRYLENLRRGLESQILLEARVLEVTPRGPDAWGRLLHRPGLAQDLDALQARLGDFGRVRVVSALRVTALNNHGAAFTLAAHTAGEAGGTASARPSRFSFNITPHIDGESQVVLHWRPSMTDGRGRLHLEAESVVKVPSGGTVALRGFVEPVPGEGADDAAQAAKELIVLVRPTVLGGVRPGAMR